MLNFYLFSHWIILINVIGHINEDYFSSNIFWKTTTWFSSNYFMFSLGINSLLQWWEGMLWIFICFSVVIDFVRPYLQYTNNTQEIQMLILYYPYILILVKRWIIKVSGLSPEKPIVLMSMFCTFLAYSLVALNTVTLLCSHHLCPSQDPIRNTETTKQ